MFIFFPPIIIYFYPADPLSNPINQNLHYYLLMSFNPSEKEWSGMKKVKKMMKQW